MKRLQVPYNWDLNILNIYKKYSNDISSIYFPANPLYFPTARPFTFPADYSEHEKIIINFCNENQIKSVLLLNGSISILEDSDVKSLYSYIDNLVKIGLSAVVISNPIFINFLSDNWPQLQIRISILSLEWTLGKIISLYQTYSKKIYGICLPIEFNRDEDALKILHNICPDLKLTTLVTSVCRINCPLYGWHQAADNASIESNNEKTKIVRNWYKEMALNLNRSVYKIPFILPEELNYYDKYFNEYKIEGRSRSTDQLERFLKYYALRTNPIYLYEIIGNYSSTLCCPCPPNLRTDSINNDWLLYRKNCKSQCWKECKYESFCNAM